MIHLVELPLVRHTLQTHGATVLDGIPERTTPPNSAMATNAATVAGLPRPALLRSWKRSAWDVRMWWGFLSVVRSLSSSIDGIR